MNIKILFLILTLVISNSLLATAQGPNPLLVQIMQEHFGRGSTDQDLIEARDARNYTILHVILEKITLARNTSDLMPLFIATDSIPQPIKKQINQALEKENRTIPNDVVSLVEQIQSHSSPEIVESINANFTLLRLYQENIRFQNENYILKLQLKASGKVAVTFATVASGIIGGMACWIIADKYFSE